MLRKHGRTQKPKPSTQEVQEFWKQRKQLEEACVQKWSRAKFSESDNFGHMIIDLYEKNPDKARYVAKSIDNEHKALKMMSESTMAQAFGPALRPENFLKAVYIGTANSKRGDFLTEVALNSVDDALIYINMTRSDTLSSSTAGDYMYQTTDPYYEGEQKTGAIGTSDGATTTYTSSPMTILPIIPYSIRVLAGGAQVGVDTGNGVISGPTLDTGSVVDYTTGVITVVFKAGSVPANTTALTVVYNWNSELASNFSSYIGKMDIGLEKIRFSARPYPLGYSISMMTQIMFDKNGIGDAQEMLEKAVGHEHARARGFRAIARMRQLALGNSQLTFNTDFASAGEVSYKSHAQRVLPKIGEATAELQDLLQRGAINKIVAGQKTVNYFKNHELWTTDTTDSRAGVYKAGMLDDIEVFACPADNNLVKTNEALLSFKNPDEPMDTPIIYGTVTEIDASLTYPNFITEGYSATVEDSKVINSNFIKLMTLQNL